MPNEVILSQLTLLIDVDGNLVLERKKITPGDLKGVFEAEYPGFEQLYPLTSMLRIANIHMDLAEKEIEHS